MNSIRCQNRLDVGRCARPSRAFGSRECVCCPPGSKGIVTCVLAPSIKLIVHVRKLVANITSVIRVCNNQGSLMRSKRERGMECERGDGKERLGGTGETRRDIEAAQEAVGAMRSSSQPEAHRHRTHRVADAHRQSESSATRCVMHRRWVLSVHENAKRLLCPCSVFTGQHSASRCVSWRIEHLKGQM